MVSRRGWVHMGTAHMSQEAQEQGQLTSGATRPKSRGTVKPGAKGTPGMADESCVLKCRVTSMVTGQTLYWKSSAFYHIWIKLQKRGPFNPSYLGGRGRRTTNLRPTWAIYLFLAFIFILFFETKSRYGFQADLEFAVIFLPHIDVCKILSHSEY